MTKHLTPTRPALAAIAAVLAFGSTTAFAQEAQPQVTPPAAAPAAPVMQPSAPMPQVAAPEAAAPATAPVVQAPPAAPAASAQAPLFKAQSPVVQPTPPRPVMAAPAPEADAAPAQEEVAPKAARERVTARTGTPEAASSASSAKAPVATPTSDATPVTSAPSAAPVSMADTVPTPAPAAVAPAPVQPADNGMSDEAKFAIGAGVTAILAAGAAFALRRRKGSYEDAAPVTYEPVGAPAPIAPTLSQEPSVKVRPVREPVMATATSVESPYVQPAYADDEHVRPAAHAAAPSTSLEAMVAESPSAANPFLTRRNRLRRATFLLNQAETGNHAAPARQEKPVAAPQGEMVTKEVRAQPVYDFGKVSTGWRRLTPATT
ncbi:MAG TPA: hypothetical protein VF509_06630 [Sphingobium sp.]